MTKAEAETILIFEPDILIRHPLAQYLRECGYRVLEVSSTLEAREVLDAPGTEVDLLFASGAGGDADSFSLGAWTRERRPEVEVVLAGALRAATEKAARLCEDGPAAAKPYEHRFVYDRIRRLLAARGRASGGTLA